MQKFVIDETKLSAVMQIIEEAAELMAEKNCEDDNDAMDRLEKLQQDLRNITENEKIRNVLRLITDSVILAGGIVLFIGLYYAIIKAGIPYQDPPLELQIRYEVNARIGDILTKNGFIITLFGGMCRLVVGCVRRKR